MERRFAVALQLALVGCLSGNVSASDLFGVRLQFDDPTPLYSVNQSTGALTTLGETGFADVTDLTSNPLTGTLWGVDVNTNQLLKINRHTGATSAIQMHSDHPIVSIAFDPVTRRLFGNAAVEFGDTTGDTLYEIDPITGHTTLKGAIGFAAVFGLGFDQHGTLFGISDAEQKLISIDTSTGTGSFVAQLHTDPNVVISGFDIASRPEDNTMFLADGSSQQLYTLDTSSGFAALVGPYEGSPPPNIVGLAFLSEAPEASTYVALIMGLSLLVMLRRP